MASIQARHSRSCELSRDLKSGATTTEDAPGCTCRPALYVVTRAEGRFVRDLVGKDPKAAAAALTKVQHEQNTGAYVAPQPTTFGEWADEWLEGLRGRSTTKAVYAITLGYARSTFGRKQLRRLTGADVRKFLATIERENRKRGRTVTGATLAKHLRQLSSCLEAARADRLLVDNPCRGLHKSARPKVAKGTASYFTDDELARLWPELAARPVYLTVCKLAVTTGARYGELAGLRWPDVKLLDGELHLHHQFTAGAEVPTTKDNEPRVVDLVPAARALLEEWYAATGDVGLVFENETGGHLDDSKARKVLYEAMARAGVPRVGERGGKPRNLHSFRHTFARIALEHGSELTWVQAQLGHSSIELTRKVYGSWSREAEKVAAGRLAGAFTV